MYNMCNIIFIKLLNIYNKEIYHIIYIVNILIIVHTYK